ncbi:MAG: ribose-phosphate diphosphokinase [bacterium]
MVNNIKIFSGRVHPELAGEIAEKLNIPLGKIKITNFPDGEVHVQIEESLRGKKVFLIQPTCIPVNESIMELLIMVDACRRASAEQITAIIPYFGYSRQDKKETGREPISAKLVMNLLSTAGVDRIVSVDLHQPQIQAFFDKPFDHLTAFTTIANYLKKKNLENPVIVSPDAGRAKIAEKYASHLGYPMIIMHKTRKGVGGQDVSLSGIIGNPKDKTPIIIDDIMAGGSTVKQALALLDNGCREEIYFALTHPILIDKALERLSHPAIKEVIVTNSVPVKEKQDNLSKITILSLANLLSDVIYRIHHNISVSEVFQTEELDFPV